MVMKRRKYTVKTKSRIFIISFVFITIIFTLFYTLFNDMQNINILIDEKKELMKEKESLKEKQASLNADIERLSDDLYVARYAREKYFYSKDGEIILKMDEYKRRSYSSSFSVFFSGKCPVFTNESICSLVIVSSSNNVLAIKSNSFLFSLDSDFIL